jgi:omega-amidase
MMAKRSGALIVGSIIFKEEGKFLNRLFWVEPQGKILTYDKRHLFRMGNEHSVFSVGNGKLISTWMGWRICPLICYDLRFPVWSRNGYSEAGEFSYDLLIYVANWPAARNQAWETLVRARAIENLSYVAALNRIGSDGKQVDHIGNSSIIAPQGDLIQNLGSLDTVVVTQISKSVLLDYRQKFPAFLDADSFEIDVN